MFLVHFTNYIFILMPSAYFLCMFVFFNTQEFFKYKKSLENKNNIFLKKFITKNIKKNKVKKKIKLKNKFMNILYKFFYSIKINNNFFRLNKLYLKSKITKIIPFCKSIVIFCLCLNLIVINELFYIYYSITIDYSYLINFFIVFELIKSIYYFVYRFFF